MALLSGSIDRDRHAILLQLLDDAKGQMKDALSLWSNTINDAFRPSMLDAGSPSAAQAKSRALMLGYDIVREKFTKGGMSAVTEWVGSKDALNLLQQKASCEDVLQDTHARLSQGKKDAAPFAGKPKEDTAKAEAAAKVDAFTLQPGETLEQFILRMKLGLQSGEGQ
jgi:hypothetical protein